MEISYIKLFQRKRERERERGRGGRLERESGELDELEVREAGKEGAVCNPVSVKLSWFLKLLA